VRGLWGDCRGELEASAYLPKYVVNRVTQSVTKQRSLVLLRRLKHLN
jgi:hypothetical protein